MYPRRKTPMKIKNKTRFRVLCTLYVIGYLFFCIFGGMSSGMMISDSPVLEFAAIYYGLPVGVRNLSVSMFVWIILSFFLVLAILWQTDLSKQRLSFQGTRFLDFERDIGNGF